MTQAALQTIAEVGLDPARYVVALLLLLACAGSCFIAAVFHGRGGGRAA